MEQLFCGIDLGTTNLKVLLCDAQGAVVALRACPTPRVVEDDQPATDPVGLLTAIEALLDDAYASIGRNGRIVAVSTAGVGEDGFMLGDDGAPLGQSLPWFDRRAEAEAEELARLCDVSAAAGIGFDPTRTAAKWLWLARHHSDALALGQWVALTDWPLIAWTGQPMMTEALAARTACWDITQRSWLVDALTASGAPVLPPVLRSGSVIGRLTADSAPVRIGAAGLDTLAIAGGHDHPVAAATIRAAYPAAFVDSLGTAELIHAEAPDRLHLAPDLVRTIPTAPGMRDACLYVFEFDRFLADLSAPKVRQVLDGTAPEDTETQAILTRLECAAMVTAEALDRLTASGVPHGEVFVTGGRARSARLMQMRADVLGRPLHRVDEDELCGLGAAILAAQGAGHPIVPSLKITRFAADPNAARAYHARRALASDTISSLLRNGPL